MLTIPGSKFKLCDGVSRRNFLSVGALGLGGLALPGLLKSEAKAGVGKSNKSVIMIFLPGGPPHQDMWDLKMDAPREIRGEFSPISTNVDGIQICEEFPRMAKMADKFAFIRSMVGANGGHNALQCLYPRYSRNGAPTGGWPSFGSTVSKVMGAKNDGAPALAGLQPVCGHRPWGDPGMPGFLGTAHAPFKPTFDGKADLTLNGTLDRLGDRQSLLSSFDNFRRDVDNSGLIDGLDSFEQNAFGILTSSGLAEALDLEKEDPKLRDRYGRGSAKRQADGSHKLLDDFLMARRLVEAGVRCVTLAFSRWDWHGGNFSRGRQDFPMLDQALTALVDDLDQRGMLDDTSIVVWGEFGRTPKINSKAGRDHWPRVSCAVLAGGGMKTGQVIGSTDRLGGEAASRPVKFGEVFATVYHQLGIDVNQVTIEDLSGRPQYLVDPGIQPMKELI
ncbi:MAG: hypothetical protein CMO80_09250 [Verrucomicrobiales bacterium]|nr:hypothetical protein [Verrucomicrobiales bacterium]